MLQIAVCNKDLDFMKQIEQWISKEIRKQKLSVETICFRSGDELLWGMELDGGYDLMSIRIENGKIYFVSKLSKEEWVNYGIADSQNKVKASKNYESGLAK